MKRTIMVILLALLTAPLWAAVNKGVTWVAPTERVNGDPLPAGEIDSYELECLTTSGTVVYATMVAGTDSTHRTADVFDTGEFRCRMRTVDTGGLMSEWGESNVFTVGRCEISDCRPTPPSSIVVEIQ